MMNDQPASRSRGFLLSLTIASVVGAIGLTRPATAQTTNPVYIDDAPRAWELFRLAREQAVPNAGEAIRLYQELLDDYGDKLIPRQEATNSEFVSVRSRVLADLRANEGFLQRYRVMQSAEAQRMLESSRLRELLLTRPLTESGLHAMLRSGQEALESARFHDTIAYLEPAITHPDLTPDRAAHCWLGLGLANHYLGHPNKTEHAKQMLVDLRGAGSAFLRELRQLTAKGVGPDITRGVTSLDHTDVDDLTELVAQTIWSIELGDSLLKRRLERADDDVAPSANYERRRRQGDLTTVTPTVAGSRVFVNEGHTVRALDRFTGRSVWAKPFRDRQQPLVEHDKSQVGDLNVVAVDGDFLVTLTGHAYPTSRSSDGRVVCLDARTGVLRWATDFNRLGDEKEYEGLFPHGAPIIAEEYVFVLARKVSPQMLTGCYIIALELETGEVDWIRHVASSGSKTKTGRAFSSLVYDDGQLFVSSAVGAIACLEAATGSTRWLRRYPVPVHIRGRARQPWQISGPVVVADRVIAITPDQRRITVLDRDTGDALETHEAWTRDRWNAPEYLLATDKMVYGIGSEIRAFATDILERPVWRLPAAPESLVDDVAPDDPAGKSVLRSSQADALTVVGRVQLVSGALVVPTAGGVLLVDAETGRVDHRLAINTAGNPVAVGAQLVLAGGDALEAYMSLSRAEDMLRERIASAEADPDPALSLLQLGMRVGSLSLALEGADLSLRAIEQMPRNRRAPGARRELFNMLLEVHERAIAQSVEEREALYGMIGAVAATTEQRVEYLLAYGDGLAAQAPDRAVETYQAILSDDVLRSTVRSEAGLIRPASAWACARLASLVERVGPGVYDPQADFARESLRHLLDSRPMDDDALAALANEFPFAEAAISAALEAARLQRDRGDDRQALSTLATLYHLAPSAVGAPCLLGAFVETCLASDRIQVAERVLAAVAPRLGRPLETQSGPRAPDEWLAELQRESDATRRPRVVEWTSPVAAPIRALSGRLVTAPRAARLDQPSDRALLLTEQGEQSELRMIGAGELETVWAERIDGADVDLLHIDGDRVLLWVGENSPDPHVLALETLTGRQLWTTPKLADQLPEPLAQARAPDRQLPDGKVFERRELIPVVGQEAIFVVRRNGGVAAFDRDHGQVLWTAERAIEDVHYVTTTGLGVVLVGLDVSPDGDRDRVPRIVVLDAQRGSLVHEISPASRDAVLWVESDALGTLLCATNDGLEAIDLLSGRRRWTNVAFDATEARSGWSAERDFVVENRESSLFMIDSEDGTLSQPFDTSIRGNWERDSLQDVAITGDRILAHYRDRIVRYDRAGNVRGADIVAESRDFRWLLEGDDRLVVVSQHDTRQVQVNDAGDRRTLRTYHAYVLSDTCKLEGEIIAPEPIQKRLTDAALMDGWLLLSTGEETLAVPLGAE